MIHWTWILFTTVVIILLIAIFKDRGGGDYSFDLITPFILIVLIAFILIWGGIFWW